MIKKSLLAGVVLTLPALALAPRGPVAHYVPVAQADEKKEPTAEELGKQAWGVLEKHCTACHADGKGKHRASPIDKTTYQKLIDKKHVVPNKPDESPVYTTMISEDEPMPPKKVKERPTKEEIALIKTWIEKGAPAWPTEAK